MGPIASSQTHAAAAPRTQTALTASLLIMGSSLLSGLLSLLRNTLVARYFGAGPETAAYTVAFQLPDMIQYYLIGGVASTAFVAILTRYRETGREGEGDEALSVILNALSVLLLLVIGIAEVFAPEVISLLQPGFRREPVELALTTHLTRILLLNPLFFFTGGVFGARLLVRKIFIYQAASSVLYSGGILLGAVLLHRQLGIDSLAWGAVAGALAGPLLNVFGSRRAGMRWSPLWGLRHPALREWFVLSLPLMLGQSLVTLDPWIRNHFASDNDAGLSRLNFARQLFMAPMNVLGPAAGIASLPFFASLWAQNRRAEFSAAVDRAVSNMIAVSLLAAGWMIAFAPLIIAAVLRGGRFSTDDAALTSRYFILYTLSLFLWTSQNLYARGFYAAGDTRTPMISGTVVTLAAIPVYASLYRALGLEGLVWAADIGMLLHTGALAMLLHRQRMVSLAELDVREIVRALLVSAGTAGLGIAARGLLPPVHSRVETMVELAVCSAAWALLVAAALRLTGSQLLDPLLRRFRRALPSGAAA